MSKSKFKKIVEKIQKIDFIEIGMVILIILLLIWFLKMVFIGE